MNARQGEAGGGPGAVGGGRGAGGDAFTAAGTTWAVMAMEAAVVYPFLAHWLSGAAGSVPLGPLAALALLPLGLLAVRHSPVRGHLIHRWPYGVATALGLRLLATLPLLLGGAVPGAGAQQAAPLQVVTWLLAALLPTAVGFGLWWRGTSLAEAELTAEGVRNEFVLLGCGLLGALTLFRDLAGIGPLTSAIAVVGFLGGGLVAVALARQEEAGLAPTAGSSALVAWAVLVVLLASVVLVALLSPELAAAILTLVGDAVGVVLWLLMLPLMWLFSWLQIRLPLPGEVPVPEPVGSSGELAQRPDLPEWLLATLGVLLSVLAVVALALVVAVLLWLLLALLQRTSFRIGARAPVAVESEDVPWQDARGLLDGLRGWLGRLGSGALAGRGERDWRQVRDARAAYRALLRWARERDLPRAPAETPAEFERRLTERLPDGSAHYRVLTVAYERARYGDEDAGGAEVARLRESLGALEVLRAET